MQYALSYIYLGTLKWFHIYYLLFLKLVLYCYSFENGCDRRRYHYRTIWWLNNPSSIWRRPVRPKFREVLYDYLPITRYERWGKRKADKWQCFHFTKSWHFTPRVIWFGQKQQPLTELLWASWTRGGKRATTYTYTAL